MGDTKTDDDAFMREIEETDYTEDQEPQDTNDATGSQENVNLDELECVDDLEEVDDTETRRSDGRRRRERDRRRSPQRRRDNEKKGKMSSRDREYDGRLRASYIASPVDQIRSARRADSHRETDSHKRSRSEQERNKRRLKEYFEKKNKADAERRRKRSESRRNDEKRQKLEVGEIDFSGLEEIDCCDDDEEVTNNELEGSLNSNGENCAAWSDDEPTTSSKARRGNYFAQSTSNSEDTELSYDTDYDDYPELEEDDTNLELVRKAAADADRNQFGDITSSESDSEKEAASDEEVDIEMTDEDEGSSRADVRTYKDSISNEYRPRERREDRKRSNGREGWRRRRNERRGDGQTDRRGRGSITESYSHLIAKEGVKSRTGRKEREDREKTRKRSPIRAGMSNIVVSQQSSPLQNPVVATPVLEPNVSAREEPPRSAQRRRVDKESTKHSEKLIPQTTQRESRQRSEPSSEEKKSIAVTSNKVETVEMTSLTTATVETPSDVHPIKKTAIGTLQKPLVEEEAPEKQIWIPLKVVRLGKCEQPCDKREQVPSNAAEEEAHRGPMRRKYNGKNQLMAYLNTVHKEAEIEKQKKEEIGRIRQQKNNQMPLKMDRNRKMKKKAQVQQPTSLFSVSIQPAEQILMGMPKRNKRRLFSSIPPPQTDLKEKPWRKKKKRGPRVTCRPPRDEDYPLVVTSRY